MVAWKRRAGGPHPLWEPIYRSSRHAGKHRKTRSSLCWNRTKSRTRGPPVSKRRYGGTRRRRRCRGGDSRHSKHSRYLRKPLRDSDPPPNVGLDEVGLPARRSTRPAWKIRHARPGNHHASHLTVSKKDAVMTRINSILLAYDARPDVAGAWGKVSISRFCHRAPSLSGECCCSAAMDPGPSFWEDSGSAAISRPHPRGGSSDWDAGRTDAMDMISATRSGSPGLDFFCVMRT